MNLSKIGIVALVVGGLLVGCQTAETSKPKEEVKSGGEASEQIKVSTAKAEEIDPKAWKDLSSAGDLEKPDFTTNVKGWISNTWKIHNQEPDGKLIEAGHDEYYDYYLKAEAISNTLGRFIKVEGVDLEKDFENLRMLALMVRLGQDVRTAEIDPMGYGEDKLSAVKDWKPASERLKLTVEYMGQLLHDINIAINNNGNGEVFGVSNQLDGEKVGELELFIESFKQE